MHRKDLYLLLAAACFLFPSLAFAETKGGTGKAATIPSLTIGVSSSTKEVTFIPSLPTGTPFTFLDASPSKDGTGSATLLYFTGDTPVRVKYTFKTTTVSPDPAPDPKPPDPVPDPKPPVPKPDAKYQVCFINETGDLDNLPQGQRDMLASLIFKRSLKAKGHTYIGTFDRGMVGPDNKVPPAYAGWWQAIEGKTLPQVCIAPLDAKTSEDVVSFSLPATEAEFWKLLESGGKP